MEYWTDEQTEPDSDNDRVGRKYLWNSVGWRRPTSFQRDEDGMLLSSQFVSNTWEVELYRRLSDVSQLQFYVLIGLGKPSAVRRLGTIRLA